MHSECRITGKAEMQKANTWLHAGPYDGAGMEACSLSTCHCTLHGFSAVAGLVMAEHKANKVYSLARLWWFRGLDLVQEC